MIDTKEYQIWFREHIDEFPSCWDQEDLRHFSPNFFREYRNRFTWHAKEDELFLTRPAIFVWKRFGDDFFREMTGERRKRANVERQY